ncbi:MAG TPA: VOC family protein [Candidatus Kapabacteria bacterium]|nr:VOC family protein [Candidatus Kapabacteria bacterium]
MATVTSYKPGNFSWCELVTSDQAAAKSFYSKVFGWDINDSPMGPDQFYTMLEIGGKPVGALYGMDKAQMDRGIPPHWNVYVSVTNVDESTKKAASLGGQILMEPFDVMEHGRMSIVKDPTGGMICLWQPVKFPGASLVGENGAFCWWELYTNDIEGAKKFYTSLFGWTTGGDANYAEWKNSDGVSIGGMMQIQKEWGEVPPHWMSYVMVADCDKTAELAKSLGAQVFVGPQDIPNMGRFAVLDDPQHAGFAIYQMAVK